MKLIKNFHPIGSQFVYAISYLTDQLIYVSDEIIQILGYRPYEVSDFSFLYDKIHPDDVEAVKKLTIKAISAGSGAHRLKPMDQVFHIIYRIRRKDGKYIKVQRQTGLLTKDVNHDMITSFGIYTDVSHLSDSEEVQAYMSGPEIPDYRFSSSEDKNKVRFTRREKEIINLLSGGLNSENIGKKLYISKETVNTHRRNILQKAGVKNSTGLMAYVFKNGY